MLTSKCIHAVFPVLCLRFLCGIRPPWTENHIFFQILFNKRKQWEPTNCQGRKKLLQLKTMGQIFSFCLAKQILYWSQSSDGSTFVLQAIACLIAHVSVTFKLLISFAMLSPFCKLKEISSKQCDKYSRLNSFYFLIFSYNCFVRNAANLLDSRMNRLILRIKDSENSLAERKRQSYSKECVHFLSFQQTHWIKSWWRNIFWLKM